jgi:hypothetical protein
MRYSYSQDGRFLTPPKELKPIIKDAFPAFYKLLGHIRFFYMVDEIWDGKSILRFTANDKQLAEVVFEDGVFSMNIANNTYQVIDETLLPKIFNALNKNAATNQMRPAEQLTANLDEYPNAIRCDLCQCNIINNTDDFSGKKKFRTMDRHCYYGVQEGWGESGVDYCPITCEGKQHCHASTYSCLEKKGFKNCLECGEYHTCGNCGVGHNPGECNLGITAEEVTNLIIPYCEHERLDYMALQNTFV